TWQMGGASGPCDDNLEAGSAGLRGKTVETLRRAMRRDDPHVIIDVQRSESFGGMTERRPVRLAPHDDGDRFCPHARSSRLRAIRKTKPRIIGRVSSRQGERAPLVSIRSPSQPERGSVSVI